MAERILSLTEEERKYLADLLEATLKDTRVEEHRTRNIAFREHIVKNEELITSIQRKLQSPS